MGLFSKLRADLNHGGVKVQIQSPSSTPADKVVPVTLTVSTDTPQTINSVTVELQSQAREQGFGLGSRNGVSADEQETTYQTVSQAQSREAFSINPGEAKTVNLELYFNGTGGMSPVGQAGNVSGAIGGALQSIASVAQRFENVSYNYRLHASLDVQGVGIGPSDNVPIQILPPATGPQPVPTPGSQV